MRPSDGYGCGRAGAAAGDDGGGTWPVALPWLASETAIMQYNDGGGVDKGSQENGNIRSF
jgi:hypothetical protein